MPKRMLIDASHPEETRVVVLDGNRVEEFDFEAASKRPLKGNIYLAKVTRVEPSLQAAFVEYGGNRQGFLAFSEIHPDYYQIPVADRMALLAAQTERAMADEEEFDSVEVGTSRGQRSMPLDDESASGESSDDESGEDAEAEASDENESESEMHDESSAQEADDSDQDQSTAAPGEERNSEVAELTVQMEAEAGNAGEASADDAGGASPPQERTPSPRTPTIRCRKPTPGAPRNSLPPRNPNPSCAPSRPGLRRLIVGANSATVRDRRAGASTRSRK